MENVILFDNFNNFKKIPDGISRIYFGNEFCDHLLPVKKDIDKLVELKNSRGVQFGIVTPYINQHNLDSLIKLLYYIDKELPGTEIIVNDWGVLYLIKQRFHKLSLIIGRLLTRQRRGFFVKSKAAGNILVEDIKLKNKDIEYLRSSILQNRYLMNYLTRIGVNRIGLDNIKQGMIFKNTNIKIDLYYPFVYITTSNYCLTASLHSRDKLRTKINRCNKICKKCSRRELEINGKKIFLFGNTQYYFNNRLDKVETGKIDRFIRTLMK